MSTSLVPENNAPDDATAEKLPLIIRALNVVERVGNKLPHPFWLFWILAGLLAATSALLAALQVTVQVKGKEVMVRSLFSADGLRMVVGDALDGYAEFPPLITIMVVIMGVGIAERSGFLATWMRMSISRVPASLMVFSVAFLGTVSHVASAAAYVILVPLGGIAFRAVGRSPVLGVVVAYTSIASGYDASPVPTPNDAIFAGITTAAARLVNPDAYVSPLSNWYFNIASSILLAIVITVVTELVLARRTNLGADDDLVDDEQITITDRERSGLKWAQIGLVISLLIVVALVVPANAPLRAPGGGLDKSPFLTGIAFIIALLFGIAGTIFGLRSGSIKNLGEVPKLMAEGLRTMAPVLVLFFAISQFLNYFEWTRIGDVVSVRTAALFQDLGVPPWLIFLMVLGVLSVINVLITSGSAMWAIMAPVIVPLLLHLGIPAETAQALFRIADSGSTAITPMSPYFVMALGFMQRYQKKAGIGTLASHTLPLAVCMTLSWTVLFFVWWGLGIPLGPGAPVR